MSTRSVISVENKITKNVEAIYCHYDGYLEVVGKTLQENYMDDDTIKELIDLGDISSLGKEIGVAHIPRVEYDPELSEDQRDEKRAKHVELYGDMTTAYGRDMDDDSPATTYESKDELLTLAPENYGAEFVYSFSNNEWLVASKETQWKYEVLEDQLSINGIEYHNHDTQMNETTKTTIELGKVDYTGNGIEDNSVDIELKLENGVFTASGSIWNRLKTDIVSGGQNIDEIAKLFPDNVTVAKVHAIWAQYHLNNLNAGTQLQEDYLLTQKSMGRLSQDAGYEDKCEALKEAGLFEVEHENNPYEYGAGWIKKDLPQSIEAEIKSIFESNTQTKVKAKQNKPSTSIKLPKKNQ